MINNPMMLVSIVLPLVLAAEAAQAQAQAPATMNPPARAVAAETPGAAWPQVAGVNASVYLRQRVVEPHALRDLRALHLPAEQLVVLLERAERDYPGSPDEAFEGRIEAKHRPAWRERERIALAGAAAHLLGSSESPLAAPALTRVLLDTTHDVAVRMAVTEALGATRAPDAVKLLARLAIDPRRSEPERIAALAGLGAHRTLDAGRTLAALVDATTTTTTTTVALDETLLGAAYRALGRCAGAWTTDADSSAAKQVRALARSVLVHALATRAEVALEVALVESLSLIDDALTRREIERLRDESKVDSLAARRARAFLARPQR